MITVVKGKVRNLLQGSVAQLVQSGLPYTGESRRFKSYQTRVKGVGCVRDRLSVCTTALE